MKRQDNFRLRKMMKKIKWAAELEEGEGGGWLRWDVQGKHFRQGLNDKKEPAVCKTGEHVPNREDCRWKTLQGPPAYCAPKTEQKLTEQSKGGEVVTKEQSRGQSTEALFPCSWEVGLLVACLCKSSILFVRLTFSLTPDGPLSDGSVWLQTL